MSSGFLSRYLLLTSGLLLIVLASEAQQNGEVMVANYFEGRGSRTAREKTSSLSSDESTKIQYLDSNGKPVLVQFTYSGPPKILPIATADSYPEGSSINLICTVSGGQRRGLVLSWTWNGDDLDDQRLKYSNDLDNVSIGADDADISILKIKNATSVNSGQYACTAKNPLGQDSTSVKIVINVELKWSKIPRDIEVGLNQELVAECDAIGSPQPTIEWIKHANKMDKIAHQNGTSVVSRSKVLRLPKAQHKDSGLYECVATNGVDEKLRKIIQVTVRGK